MPKRIRSGQGASSKSKFVRVVVATVGLFSMLVSVTAMPVSAHTPHGKSCYTYPSKSSTYTSAWVNIYTHKATVSRCTKDHYIHSTGIEKNDMERRAWLGVFYSADTWDREIVINPRKEARSLYGKFEVGVPFFSLTANLDYKHRFTWTFEASTTTGGGPTYFNSSSWWTTW